MEAKENEKSWFSDFSRLALEFKEKSLQLAEAMASMPAHEFHEFLKRHADITIRAFRTSQSALFRMLGEEKNDIEKIRLLFIEMSRRFDEMQALFFAFLERYDKEENPESGDSE